MPVADQGTGEHLEEVRTALDEHLVSSDGAGAALDVLHVEELAEELRHGRSDRSLERLVLVAGIEFAPDPAPALPHRAAIPVLAVAQKAGRAGPPPPAEAGP